MEALWAELAASTPNDLLIATFRADVNDVEEFERDGRYPILKFYAKENKEAVDYKGERTLEEF